MAENENKTVNEEVKDNRNVIFAREVTPIKPVTYFFMNAGNAILKGILWVVDFVLSMFVSLGQFFWNVIKGAGKGCVGVYNFFKRKCHQFRYNDWSGRLSYLIFGTSSLKHGQYANGIMYLLFEIGYILLFAFFGVPALKGIGPLGPVHITEHPWEDPNFGPQVDVVYEGNSIISLIFGIATIISMFIFVYIWYRSIESGYALYRIDKYTSFKKVTEETKEYSNKLAQGCIKAYAYGTNKASFKELSMDYIKAYIAKVEDPRERAYVKYLLLNTIDKAYQFAKEDAKLNKKRDNLIAKKDKALKLRDTKLEALKESFKSLPVTETSADENQVKVEKFENKTLSITSKWNKKINSISNVIRETEKRYSCYAEIQNTINNDKYGKFNYYFKNIADLNRDLLFWNNYSSFVDIYNQNIDKSEDKNAENKVASETILEEFGKKVAAINKKYDEIAARRTDVEAKIVETKKAYDEKVKLLKAERPDDLAQQLVDAKTELVTTTTRLNRSLFELPSIKTVGKMRKEEIKEVKHAATRDRRYLKTNFTPESYATQCVIDSMVVDHKIDYKVAKYYASVLFKNENKQKVPFTQSEVMDKIAAIEKEKAEFIAKNPSKYVGKPKEFKAQLKGLLNENFHITILALPILGIIVISIIPLIFSILIAFTDFSYSAGTLPPEQIHWIGFENFQALFDPNNLMFGTLPKELAGTVGWTFIWAICATFSNYFLGIIVALMINKDGIKFKKFWRTIFVLTIAIPQFISLLSIARLMSENGAIDMWYKSLTNKPFGFALDHDHILMTKVIIIVINIWVGIPYTILSTTGILLNIPKDLYESSRVDGAGTVTQFFKITMPYILFVTGPYLITQFIGNFNNFNVIYFLTQGGPKDMNSFLGVGETDLLITFLFKVVTEKQEYGIASTIGIFIFIICAFFSIVMYNKTGSIKEEDQFQ